MTHPTRRRPRWLVATAILALTAAACSSQEQDADPAGSPRVTSDTATTGPPDTAAASAPDMSTWTPEAAPTGEAGQPRGLAVEPVDVDDRDVDQVAQAFALTMLTPDTRLDRTPLDLARRASRWMTPEYAEQLTVDRPSSGGAEWIALADSQGYYSAQLIDTPATEQGLVTTGPEDLSAERPYLATLSAHDADLPEQSTAVVVYLTRIATDAPWQVYDWYQEVPHG